MRRLTKVTALFLAIALLTGCAAGRAFRRGEDRARVGDWDSAVTYYRTAVQADPDKPEYRIALERAMLNASRQHFDNARALEAKDQLDAALLEYRRTVEFDPGNTQAADRVVQLEKIIRDRIEASRPKPAIVQLREQARQISAGAAAESGVARTARLQLQAGEPARHPDVHRQRDRHQRHLRCQLQRSSCDCDAAGIDRAGAQHPAVVERTVLLRARRADDRRRAGLGAQPAEVRAAGSAHDSAVVRRCHRAVRDADCDYADDDRRHDSARHHSEQGANTITVRATEPVVAVIRELVLSNDKPRAEVTLDVEILEVSRARVKELGLNLSDHQIGAIFSPEKLPTDDPGSQQFNLNTITQGVSTADFYLTVPQAIVRFLATDTNTKVLAQTQLRGAEGQQLMPQYRCTRTVSGDDVLSDCCRRRERESVVVVQFRAGGHQRAGNAARVRRGRHPARRRSC